jgi:AmmeMemoRadiSam system protein B
MTAIRQPAAAGLFYPGSGAGLAAEVDRLLAEAPPPAPSSGRLAALVVPHAGYPYSGPVAATAYRLLAASGAPRRVAILGPPHFVPLRGSAVPAADAWRTPLGDVVVDAGLRNAAVRAGAAVDDEPHGPEHAVEVQLPFLQRIGTEAPAVLPVAVGRGDAGATAALIGALRDEGALVIVSTDLSHYHDAATAARLDRRTADAVVACDDGAIGDTDACGADALRGLLRHARTGGLEVRELDVRTSADTAGDPSRVVGYGAFAVLDPGQPGEA